MNWTNEKPTATGWYWCRSISMSRADTPCLIMDAGRGLYFGGWGDNRTQPLSEVTGLQFAGPISEPSTAPSPLPASNELAELREALQESKRLHKEACECADRLANEAEETARDFAWLEIHYSKLPSQNHGAGDEYDFSRAAIRAARKSQP